MKTALWDDPDPRMVWGNPNLRWGDPGFLLEEGDPGWVPWPPEPIPFPKPAKKKRSYKMSNPTPLALNELIAAGEDLCDGLENIGVAVGIKQNTFALARADLDALIGTNNTFKAAEGEQPVAYAALRTADSNGKAFLAAAVKVLSISLGNAWSDEWIATGLPDNTVGIPGTQDARFAALGGLKAYFLANPASEVSTAKVVVTAAAANALYQAVSDARELVGQALDKTKAKLQLREPAEAQLRKRYRGVIGELGDLLEDEDSRWYQFGLNRPADPATPGAPLTVQVTALGGGRVLAQVDGARRANSFNFYKKQVNVDAQPVKVKHTDGTQWTYEGLPVGAVVEITVTGVNDAGEGLASVPVPVTVT